MKIVRKNSVQYSSLQPGDVFVYDLTDVDWNNVYMVIDEVNDVSLYKHVNMKDGDVVNSPADFDVIKLFPTMYLEI